MERGNKGKRWGQTNSAQGHSLLWADRCSYTIQIQMTHKCNQMQICMFPISLTAPVLPPDNPPPTPNPSQGTVGS